MSIPISRFMSVHAHMMYICLSAYPFTTESWHSFQGICQCTPLKIWTRRRRRRRIAGINASTKSLWHEGVPPAALWLSTWQGTTRRNESRRPKKDAAQNQRGNAKMPLTSLDLQLCNINGSREIMLNCFCSLEH